MFATPKSTSRLALAFGLAERVYHTTVRACRSKHRNAIIALAINMLQAFVFILIFIVMMTVLGQRAKIRGDYLLFIMSGIFLFLTHNKTVGSVSGAADSISGMMQHAPMNTVISIVSAALSTLYIQVVSILTILLVYHLAIKRITIDMPIAAMGMVILAWLTGAAIGLLIMAAKPWFPRAVMIIKTLYQRANMIASGKMFVANSLSYTMLKMFDWNPLFHIIDQCRGFVFLNYSPHYSTISYPVKLTVVLLMLGLMLEFYTRQYVSRSWKR